MAADMKLIHLLVLATLAPVLLTSGAKWSYHGDYSPDKWWKIHEYCNRTRQSPVDIDTRTVIATDLGPLLLEGYDSVNEYMDFDNNGHGVTVRLAEDVSQLYLLSGGGLPTTYVATQFHFHWGSTNVQGSEHTLNGRAYPAELHVVHYDVQYTNLVEALISQNYAAVTALGFFIEVGPENNDAFDSFLDHIDDISEFNRTVGINRLGTGNLPSFPLRPIMPEDLTRFYRYNGSLTIPNCYETVVWNVFVDTIKISQEQLEKFRGVYGDEEDSNGTQLLTLDNFRPTLPLYDRTVYYSRPQANVPTQSPTLRTIQRASEGPVGPVDSEDTLGGIMTVVAIVLGSVLVVVFIWAMIMSVFYVTIKGKLDKLKHSDKSSGKAVSSITNQAYMA